MDAHAVGNASPETPMKEHFIKLGGYEGLKQVSTSLVQVGAVLYDLKEQKVLKTLSINVQHDAKSSKFTPTDYTYLYAHSLTTIRFDQLKDAVSLLEASKSLCDFIGDHPWVIMDNDLNVIRRQIPDFAADRPAPIKLKPLLSTGLNSGKLHTLLNDKQKEATGWNQHARGAEHTAFFDALSMAVYCATFSCIEI